MQNLNANAETIPFWKIDVVVKFYAPIKGLCMALRVSVMVYHGKPSHSQVCSDGKATKSPSDGNDIPSRLLTSLRCLSVCLSVETETHNKLHGCG